MECINCGKCWVSVILILSTKQTTPTLNNQLHRTAVSACTHWCTRHYCMFQWLQTPQLIHLYLQGKFFLPPCKFPSVFCFTHSICKLLLLVSDGGSQLRVYPHDAEGWGHHPAKYTPLPGWDQPRRYPFLSHTAYSPHATYLSLSRAYALSSLRAPLHPRNPTRPPN